MSDDVVNPAPRPGQVWAYKGLGKMPHEGVLVSEIADESWNAYSPESESFFFADLGVRTYLREATPSERKAAGLPEEPSGTDLRRVVGAVVRNGSHENRLIVVTTGMLNCQRRMDGDCFSTMFDFAESDVFVRWATRKECERHGVPYIQRGPDGEPCPAPATSPAAAPTMADLAAVRAERDAALRDAAEQRKRVAELLAERDAARRRANGYYAAWTNEARQYRDRAEKAERERYEAVARAEKAERMLEAEHATLTKKAERECDEARATRTQITGVDLSDADENAGCKIAPGNDEMDNLTVRGAWIKGYAVGRRAERAALSSPPAPSLDALTAEDRAWMNALQEHDAEWARPPFSVRVETARAAIAKRAAKGV